MTEDDDYDYYDDKPPCPRCDGQGEVDCHCGGDLCVCTNYGTRDCPLCGGEGEVSEAEERRYLDAEQENIRLFHEAWAKVEAERGSKEGRDG